MISALSFALVLVFAPRTPAWLGALLISAAATLGCLLLFGVLNWQHRDFLTACDIFFMGSSAAGWNLSAAGVVVLSCVFRVWPQRQG
jgi:hypothetical protein